MPCCMSGMQFDYLLGYVIFVWMKIPISLALFVLTPPLLSLMPPSNLAMITKSLSLSPLMEAVRCGAAASWMSMATRDGAYPYALV